MYLSELSGGRDNNFNLIRFIAASLVLLSHSFALSTGSPEAEPLRTSLGMTWGSIAVDIFFVASGFLVTGSLLTRKDLAEFALARFLRIYPGLWVALILTLIIAGCFITALPVIEFFLSAETWKYLFFNGSIYKAAFNLPGVFEDLPWKKAVNGSLWTLPVEVRMYCALAAAWWISTKTSKSPATRFSMLCIAIGIVSGALSIVEILTDRRSTHIPLAFMFFSGAAFWVLQGRIRISCAIFVVMLTAICLASEQKSAFGIVYSICIPYLVLYLAHVPGGFIRKFNRLGDYSYGIYIYAFPVQQILAFLWWGINPYEMMVLSFVVTLTMAIASWTLVEKRALGLKRKYMSAPAA